MSHIPRKRFGQHFLCDKAVIQRIIASLAPKKDDHLVEIGPGQGALTFPILNAGYSLDAVELDRDLIQQLEARTQHPSPSTGHLKIYSSDVLEFDFASLKTDARLLRVFGNLPYNISTPLIFHLIGFNSVISDMLFMLQKEVADRLTASASTEDYGRLSVMAQYHFKIESLFHVPASAFYPPPKVQSSIVRFVPSHAYETHDYALFADLVRHAFGQRRKTLRNSLKDLIDDEAWSKMKIRPDLRPENLTTKDFVEMSNVLYEIKQKK